MTEEILTIIVHSDKVKKGDILCVRKETFRITSAKKLKEGGKQITFVPYSHKNFLKHLYELIMTNHSDIQIIRKLKKPKKS